MNEEQDEYEFLHSHVPQRPELLLATCNANLNAIRREIIKKQRIISLYQYVKAQPDDLPFLPPPQKRTQWLFRPNDTGSFYGSSQLSQNTSFLISFLQDNPEKFARVVVGRAKSPDFKHIISAVIPSIFGFFSSAEQLDYAHCFYANVLDIAPPALAVEILEPFFQSGCVFRFIEFALTQFFQSFLLDLTLTNEDKKPGDPNTFIQIRSIFLVGCFTSAVKLLPEQYLQIFKQIRPLKWPTSIFADLVLVRFLWRATLTWIKVSPCCNHEKMLKKILADVGNHKEQIMDLYTALFHSQSVFQPPLLYQAFDQPYINYFMCVCDICLLARMFDDQKLLPNSLTLTDFISLNKEVQFEWYWSQVYPRHTPHRRPLQHIIFDVYPHSQKAEKETNTPKEMEYIRHFRYLESLAIDEDPIDFVLTHAGTTGEFPIYARNKCIKKLRNMANDFENLMERSRLLNQLNAWCDILKSHETMILIGATEEAVMNHQSAKSQIYLTPQLHQFMILMVLDKNYQDLIEPYTPAFQELGAIWDEEIKSIVESLPVPNILEETRESYKNIVYDSIRLLRCIDRIPYSRKYHMFMQSLTQLEAVAKRHQVGDYIYPVVMNQVPGNILLTSFCVLNACVLRSLTFSNICPESETKLWLKLETSIMKLAQKNQDFLVGLITKQDELRARYKMLVEQNKPKNLEKPIKKPFWKRTRSIGSLPT